MVGASASFVKVRTGRIGVHPRECARHPIQTEEIEMGREIRSVPSDWEHPKYEENEIRYEHQRDQYHPMYDEFYDTACTEWYEAAAAFKPVGDIKFYHDYNGPPPKMEYYRSRDWSVAEATHFQMYETVSEGTPVSPVFATKEELVQYLIKNGDYWDQKRGHGGWNEENARSFVEREFAFSMMGVAGQVKMPRDQ
jgi:hypothetical protein